MPASWGIYYQPLHLNNTLGMWNPGGDYTDSTTTPIMVLTDAQGSGYTPMTTQFIDVYSGGSPFTLTQELVQRGAEVQEEEMQIAVCGNTMTEVLSIVGIIRQALSNQEYAGSKVLSVKKFGQSDYTEWFVQSAIIQENSTFLGRDLQRNIPTVYLNIKLTRSPYGANSSFSGYSNYGSIYRNTPSSFYGDGLFDIVNMSNNQFLIGALMNVDIVYNFDGCFSDPSIRFGPSALSIVDNDATNFATISVSGTLAAGASATVYSFNYTVLNMESDAPLILALVGDVNSNEIEISASIQGYRTPFVRSVGTHINASNGTARLFIMPSLQIQNIFSGYTDYNTAISISISITIRNINRVSSRSYSFSRLFAYRSHSVTQMFPTTSWASRIDKTYIQYRIASFYDQTNMPAQPLPIAKSMVSTSGSVLADLFNFAESVELRGLSLQIKQVSGTLRGLIFNLNASCSYITPTFASNAPGLQLRFKFGALYQTIQE